MRYDPPAERPRTEEPPTQVLLAEPVTTPDADSAATDEPESGDDEGRRRLSRPSVSLTLPRLPTAPAAALTGVVVALVGIALVWGMLAGCSAVRGVSSCGGIGLLGVALVVVVQVVVATTLLTALHVAEARSTAVLGVGVLSVVALVLGYASASSAVLAVVVLLAGAPAYLLATAVTGSTFRLRD